jgi:hypothetical protein
MRVALKDLKPNPFRNFKVDPINDDVVEGLKQSIKENPAGFWGGIVARKCNGHYELAFGHHRVRAAMAAGIREDDVKVVSEISDAEMIRMYANENATQRGNTGTALAGTVASATKFLLKGLFTGTIADRDFTSRFSLDETQRQLNRDGLGEPIVSWFLGNVPGVNRNTVKQQLATLKASGDYDEIVSQVKAEIEAENKEALKALAKQEEEQRKATEAALLAEQRAKEAEERRKEAVKAERAAKEEAAKRRAEKEQRDAELEAKRAEEDAKLAEKRKADSDKAMKEFDALRKTRDAVDEASGVEREITFDFAGVAQHLNQASHIETFRKEVTGSGVKPFLPVKRQAALAAEIVRAQIKADAQAKKDGGTGVELTGRFIKDHIATMIHGVITESRKISREEKDRALRVNWESMARELQTRAARQMYGIASALRELAEHDKSRPAGVTLYLTGEFKSALKLAREALAKIKA